MICVISKSVFVAQSIPTIFTVQSPKNPERLSPAFVNTPSLFIICASVYPRIICASLGSIIPVPSVIVNSLLMVSLPKNNLGTPVEVNQILFGVLMMNWLISVLNHGTFIFAEKARFCPFPIFAKFQKKLTNMIVMITGANMDNRFLFFGLKNLKSKEFNTTETELIAIASPANSGCNVSPQVASTPAAIGIHNEL